MSLLHFETNTPLDVGGGRVETENDLVMVVHSASEESEIQVFPGPGGCNKKLC
jgi:hypothetical protein